MSCRTNTQPLQLRFSNVTLTSDGSANQNGIALQFGTPGQLAALTPSVLFNNTILNNRARCGSEANSSCIQSIGGGYTPADSSSVLTATSDSWNGSSESVADLLVNLPSTYLNDELSISTDRSLPGFPLLLQPVESLSYSVLGIGRNSTFINRLVDAGYAPSNSWSFFAGVYSSVRAGVLMIGGYADRFYEGDLHTKSVNDTCEVCFEVRRMTYVQDGVSTDLLPEGTDPFTAVVDAYYPVIIASNDMLYKFGNATNGTWQPELGLYSYGSNNVPTGNITVTLGNGLITTIPNNALFDPPAYDNGILQTFRNDSNRDTVYSIMSSEDVWYNGNVSLTNVALLGMPYAAQLYLIRDYERQTLSVANANQDAQLSGDATPICALGDEGSSGGSSNTGAIAGGVVGGVIGLALIVFLLWFLRRRKHKKAAATTTVTKEEEPAVLETQNGLGKAEMPADDKTAVGKPSYEKPAEPYNPTQELSGEDARVEVQGHHGLPPQEMPAEGKVIRSELPA